MIIEADSPFLHLPAELNIEQAAFLDGIRYSVQMIDIAHERLRQTLHHIGTEDEPADGSSPCAFHDAWSIVDSVHRLRKLLQQMPRMKQSTPGFQLFIRKTAPAKDLRDRIQHLGESMKRIAIDGSPVWGTLRWITILETSPLRVNLCTINAGRIQSGTTLMPDAFHKSFETPIDYIDLEAKPFTFEVSEGVRTITKLIHSIEPSLKKLFAGRATLMADIVIKATAVFEDAEVIDP